MWTAIFESLQILTLCLPMLSGFLVLRFHPYIDPSRLDEEADRFVNTAIDLNMVTYDEFNAYIDGWGEVWITNHPYASGSFTLTKSTSVRSNGRVRLRTTNRLRRERRRRQRDMRDA